MLIKSSQPTNQFIFAIIWSKPLFLYLLCDGELPRKKNESIQNFYCATLRIHEPNEPKILVYHTTILTILTILNFVITVYKSINARLGLGSAT